MNKHIELVKKWLADSESVSLEELEENNKNADAATDAAYWAADWATRGAAYVAADAAADAAYVAAAADAAAWAVDADYWRSQAIKYVKEYVVLTK